MTTVQLFLIALDHLLHSSCVVWQRVSIDAPSHITYGGNCWDAMSWATATHEILSGPLP